MVVSVKDAFKLIGITILMCCATFVCSIFLNYNIDLNQIDGMLSEQAQPFYDTMKTMGIIISMISGGCLGITSIIMLIFYIKNYVDTHKKELGILKAMGYSNIKVAKSFYIFGLSTLIGSSIGFASSFLLMPKFYKTQNAEGYFPTVNVCFNPSLLICLVVVPSVVFTLLAILFAYKKLKTPVIDLLKEKDKIKYKNIKTKANKETTFLQDVKKTTLKSKKTLIFFMGFASFCFSAMIQMSLSMNELASDMFGVMIFLIGVILAVTTLVLAITTVVNGNKKNIAMMRVFGYSNSECSKAILGGYRYISYIGFAIGTAYQFGLLKIMVSVVFKDIANMPTYNFNYIGFIATLTSFAVLYELAMLFYTNRIKNISIKMIMLE